MLIAEAIRTKEAQLAKLLAEHGPLPETLEVRTPRGGRHIYFRHPGTKVPSRTNYPLPALDVRGDGGYVLIPPSKVGAGEATPISPRHSPAGERHGYSSCFLSALRLYPRFLQIMFLERNIELTMNTWLRMRSDLFLRTITRYGRRSAWHCTPTFPMTSGWHCGTNGL